MTYIGSLEVHDADSHIMELPDFLAEYLESDLRDRFRSLDMGGVPPCEVSFDEVIARGGRHDPDRVSEMLALGDRILTGPRNHDALGAFDSEERRLVLDLLGVRKQLVFGTQGLTLHRPNIEIDVRYRVTRAFNRAISDFTSSDSRLVGVALVPLDDPESAVAELDSLLQLPGLGAVMVPHRDCGGRSPGHLAFDPFWARLCEARVPFVLHIGGGPRPVKEAWFENGRPRPKDWFGGAENVRAKDMIALNHAPEIFLSAMIADGIFERFPSLTGAVVELGAGWVPAFVKKLDWAFEIWKKSDSGLAELSRKPSEVVSSQLAFTPFVYEDVGDLIHQSNADLYLFSTDYPHREGGRDPLGKFTRALSDIDATGREKFFSKNFERVIPLASS
jgi:predicted TIM-barrel fold metal-dependent hydrolase